MSTGKQSIRLLQFSDVMLDARLSFKGMDMTASKRHERNNEALDSVLDLCETARFRKADAIVVAGNLWDSQSVTASTVSRLVDAFAALGEVPVVICPGHADPFNPQSFFNSNVLSAFGVRPWSKNVHIFSSSVAIGCISEMRPDVCFIGRANCETQLVAGSPRAVDTRSATCLLQVDYDAAVVQADTASNNDDYAYTAFGGSANFAQIRGDGAIKAAAAGSIIARSLEELGQRSALWVELTPLESAGYKVTVERLPADKRRLVSVSTNINGIRAQNVPDHIRKTVEASDATANDLLHVHITGIYPAGSVPDFGESELSRLFYHVVVQDATRPDYFLDKLDPRTTEGRFIQFLQEMKVKAESRGGVVPSTEYGVDLSSAIIEDALYYGLDALNQKKVKVPDVD